MKPENQNGLETVLVVDDSEEQIVQQTSKAIQRRRIQSNRQVPRPLNLHTNTMDTTEQI